MENIYKERMCGQPVCIFGCFFVVVLRRQQQLVVDSWYLKVLRYSSLYIYYEHDISYTNDTVSCKKVSVDKRLLDESLTNMN